MHLRKWASSNAGALARIVEFTHVFLTAAGRKLRTKATTLALQVDARALRGIGHAEIERTLATLTRLRNNLAEPEDNSERISGRTT